MALTISRVSALPGVLAAETIYLVKGVGNELTITVTGSTGAVVATSKSMADVNNAISTAIGSLDMSNSIAFAANIAARDALSLTKSTFVYVEDATADVTVTLGAAMYLYNIVDTSWHKVTEYESLDVQLTWAALQNKPASSVADIDSAVTQRHSHGNKAILDLLGVSGGLLTYGGDVVGGVITTGNEW